MWYNYHIIRIREVHMYALVLILNDIYKLDEINELFYDEEIGATSIDSQGMGKVLLDHNINLPMLDSVRKLIDGRKPYSKIIFSVIKDREKLDVVIEKIKKVRHGGIYLMKMMIIETLQ
jgi:nitrogen regulatory protein P-II 1